MKNLMLIVLLPAVLLIWGCSSSTNGVIGEIPVTPIDEEIPDVHERPELDQTPIPVLEGELDPEAEVIEVSADAPIASETETNPIEEEDSSEIAEDQVPDINSDDQDVIAVVVKGRCNGKNSVKVSWYDRRNSGSKSRHRAECANDEYQIEILEHRDNLKHIDVVVE